VTSSGSDCTRDAQVSRRLDRGARFSVAMPGDFGKPRLALVIHPTFSSTRAQ